MSSAGGVVGEYGSYVGGGWSLCMLGARVAWVRGRGPETELVFVDAARGSIEVLVRAAELGDIDADAGFVQLAATREHFIVALPTRSWWRRGVELRRYSSHGRLLERIGFVAGRFNGLDAGAEGIGLIVERGPMIVALRWDRGGRESTLREPRAPGPLVKPHVAADGLYFAVGPDIHRL